MAHYYLGCLLYDKKRYQEAAAHWEAAVKEKPGLAMACRNLAIYLSLIHISMPPDTQGPHSPTKAGFTTWL